MFKRILKHDFCTKTAVDFWGENLRKIYNFILMSTDAQLLALWAFSCSTEWRISSQIPDTILDPEKIPKIVDELIDSRFVEEGENMELEELLFRITLDQLKVVCKPLNIPTGKLKKAELVFKIVKHAKSNKPVFGTGNLVKRVINMVMSTVGKCFRVNASFGRLLSAIMNVYCPTTMDSSQLIENVRLNLKSNFYEIFRRVEYEHINPHITPEEVKRINIYQDINQLFGYMEAMEIEKIVLKMPKDDSAELASIEQDVRNMLLTHMNALHDSKVQAPTLYENLPGHHLKYTSLWVYARCLVHIAEQYQKLKKFQEANDIFMLLINRDCLKRFRPDQRGYYYQRLALNSHSHLKNKQDAMMFCQLALIDPLVPSKFKLDLQDRALKLNKDFEKEINLSEWETIEIVGTTIKKGFGGDRLNYFIVRDDKSGDLIHCSVEEVALRHFCKDGFTEGVFSEGRVWHALYFLVFYDILLDISIEGVWLSEFQGQPIDRNTASFYTNREEALVQRFAELESDPTKIETYASATYEAQNELQCPEIDWDVFENWSQIQRFLKCCPTAVLIKIFWNFSKDNRHTRSGFPDLVVWNNETSELGVVEIKGPGDVLSTKQRLCLDFFVQNGVRAIVCKVKAKKERI
ncbi:Fanconi-associated nuclease [Aphelenchoides bicaudatus]|nr:Fanconi-associated nuclease [Aphelenchoides bicaudatus]